MLSLPYTHTRTHTHTLNYIYTQCYFLTNIFALAFLVTYLFLSSPLVRMLLSCPCSVCVSLVCGSPLVLSRALLRFFTTLSLSPSHSVAADPRMLAEPSDPPSLSLSLSLSLPLFFTHTHTLLSLPLSLINISTCFSLALMCFSNILTHFLSHPVS